MFVDNSILIRANTVIIVHLYDALFHLICPVRSGCTSTVRVYMGHHTQMSTTCYNMNNLIFWCPLVSPAPQERGCQSRRHGRLAAAPSRSRAVSAPAEHVGGQSRRHRALGAAPSRLRVVSGRILLRVLSRRVPGRIPRRVSPAAAVLVAGPHDVRGQPHGHGGLAAAVVGGRRPSGQVGRQPHRGGRRGPVASSCSPAGIRRPAAVVTRHPGASAPGDVELLLLVEAAVL